MALMGGQAALRAAAIRPLVLVCAASLGACGGSTGAAPPEPAPGAAVRAQLVLLATTDLHGQVIPYDYDAGRPTSNGLARLAPLVDSVRGVHPGRVFLFDSGDLLHGNAMAALYARADSRRPNPIVRAMNLVGYDALAIGDHEFDSGRTHLAAAAEDASFPFLSANIYEADSQQRAYLSSVLLTTAFVEGDTILVGVTAATPPSALRDHEQFEETLEARGAVASLRVAVDGMRGRGADVVVVLFHGGLDEAPPGSPPAGAAQLAHALPDVDVVFMGHTHEQVADTVINGVHLLQAGDRARSLAAAELTLERSSPGDWRVVSARGRLLRPDPERADTAFLDSLRWDHERTLAHTRSGATPVPPAPPATRLRVLSTNDFHGHLESEAHDWSEGREVGGSAALAALFRAESEGFGGPTLIVDGGDLMQGMPISGLTYGRSTVAIYNTIGYHAAALGNHEFDWGVDVLRQRMAEADYPWLAANLFVAGADTAPPWVRPTALLDVDGVRVGIIGATTRETPEETKPSNVAGFEFRSIVDAIDHWVPVLRQEGADFVVVVAHEGAECDATGLECEGALVDVARAIGQRPDLIVGGHTHRMVRTLVNGVPLVEAASAGERYTVTDLTRMGPDSVHVWIRGVPLAYADLVPPDSVVAGMVDGFAAEIGPLVDRPVATLTARLDRGEGEYPLGRLIADAQRWATEAQVALINNGGIRSPLEAGVVSWGELNTLQPFGNTLVRLHLTGTQLRAALEHALSGARPEAQVSGVRVWYDPARSPGNRILTVELDTGEPIREDALYTVAVISYMAEGGDGFDVLTEAIVQEPTGIVDLDALVDYLEQLPQPVSAPAEARLRPVEPTQPGGTAWYE